MRNAEEGLVAAEACTGDRSGFRIPHSAFRIGWGARPMFERLRQLFSRERREARVRERLEQLRQKLPAPVFWMFGKTQSGKTSVIKYLTGAERAEIGKGFRPCTRFSQLYEFPSPETRLLSFLDTRGLDEPG